MLFNEHMSYESNQTIPLVPNVNLPTSTTTTREKTLALTVGNITHDIQSINTKEQLTNTIAIATRVHVIITHVIIKQTIKASSARK